MAPNRHAISSSEATPSTIWSVIAAAGNTAFRYFEAAVSAARTTSETERRNPEVTTRPRLANRAPISRVRIERLDVTFQMALSEAWTSPNTPVSVISAAPMPSTEAKAPVLIARALDHRLHRFRRLGAHQRRKLVHGRAARGSLANRQPGDGDRDQRHRR